MNQGSLFGNNKIILVDELEALSGRYDRGGKTKISKLIQKTSFPIVLIATDAYDRSLKTLRKKSKLVKYTNPSHEDITKFLTSILDKEGLQYEKKSDKTPCKNKRRRRTRCTKRSSKRHVHTQDNDE